jgi:phage/plasmid primase-like uncharacterized protein
MKVRALKANARGRWPEILGELGIAVPSNRRHGPCPICPDHGTDRFRLDDQRGDGTWYCNVCTPHAGDGLGLVQRVKGVTATEAGRLVATVLNGAASDPITTQTASQAQRRAEAAETARRIWESATPAPDDHPYLRRKHIKSHGLRVVPQNRLLLPIIIDNQLSSLEFIDESGNKRYLRGAIKRGCCFVLGDVTDAPTLVIAEGYATAASLHEATALPVIVALDAPNLLPVAQSIRKQHPSVTIVIAGDEDVSPDGTVNKGRQAATAAAKAIKGRLAFPPVLHGGKTDFNDVHVQQGLEAVKRLLDEALLVSSHLPGTAAHVHTPPALAKDPHILARFEEAVHMSGVVGEERCAKLVYLAVTSRLLNEPVSLVIRGLSSSGKSHTTTMTLKFFPETAVIAMTAMSSKALVYMKDSFAHRTLVLYEAVAMRESREKDDGDMTAYFIRTLLSEGRIVYPVTVRDKDEGFVTKTIVKEGPTNCIVTTTSLSLHGENETRMLAIPTNDTAEQTKAVMVRVAQGQPQEPDLGAWLDLQRWLEQADHRVIIPYATDLALSIPPIAVRLRRDIKSLLRLIDAHAILHQFNRARDEQGRIVATPDDYRIVRGLIADLVASGVGATVLETIRSTVHAVKEADQGEGATVRAVAQHLKLDRSAAQRRLQGAREKGYLVNLEDKRGRPSRYAIGEPLPEEVELLPLELPDSCAHTSDSVAPATPKRKQFKFQENHNPVQLCVSAGEKNGENQSTSMDDDDCLVIHAERPASPPVDRPGSAYQP